MKVIAISDQHGHFPDIPPCDLLIVAGDQCIDNFGGLTARAFPARQWQWFNDFWLPWRARQPVEQCVLTWGNHDYCGLKNRNITAISTQQKLTQIACDKLVEVDGLRVYLTPWSNQFMEWAFMQKPAELVAVYQAIPTNVDILVSHQPPYGCGDAYYDVATGQGMHLGSIELRAAIQRACPKAVVCGHLHGGHGTYALNGIPVYNVSVVDEAYKRVHPPTVVWEAL